MEMEYCGPRGLPHSRFLSWPVLDREKALWWLLRERTKCSQCGTRGEEWDEAQGGNRNAYAAEIVTCRGCEVRHARESSVDESLDGPGAYVVLRRRAQTGGR